MASLFTASVRPAFRALAQSFVPEIAAATGAQWTALESTISAALSQRPAVLRRQLVLLIRALDLAARVRYGAGLARLDAPHRAALLERLAGSRLLLLRRGIWGLRTLVFLGWYTLPEVTTAIGYRASPAGWSARR